MRKGANYNFNLDGAKASLGSVLFYETPLIKSLFLCESICNIAIDLERLCSN